MVDKAWSYANGTYKDAEVADFATYVANQPWDIDLIQARNISFLFGTLQVDYSTPALGVAPVGPVEDGLAKLVKNVILQWGGGAGQPIQFLDLRQCNFYGNHLMRGILRNNQPVCPVAGASQTGYVDFIITPSLNPLQPQDLHFCIPGEADHVSSLKVTGTWGSPTDLWGTVNDAVIDSATLRIYEQAGWVFSPNMQAMRNALGIDGQGYVPIPLYNPGTEAHVGAHTGLALDISLPTDLIIRRIFMVVENNLNVRDDDILTEFALRTSDNTNILGAIDFTVFQQTRSGRLDISPYTGCILIDCVRDIRDMGFAKSKNGLSLTKQDKLVFAYSTSATGRIHFLFDSVRRVKVM